MRKRQLLVPDVYRALFEISMLRDAVGGIPESDAELLARRLEQLEAKALGLIERFEEGRRVTGH